MAADAVGHVAYAVFDRDVLLVCSHRRLLFSGTPGFSGVVAASASGKHLVIVGDAMDEAPALRHLRDL